MRLKPGVDQVLHDEHLSVLDTFLQVPGNLHLPVRRVLQTEASKGEEIERDRSFDPADQITGEKEGTVENPHDHRIPIAVIARDLAPQPPDCTPNVLFAQDNPTHPGAPTGKTLASCEDTKLEGQPLYSPSRKRS